MNHRAFFTPVVLASPIFLLPVLWQTFTTNCIRWFAFVAEQAAVGTGKDDAGARGVRGLRMIALNRQSRQGFQSGLGLNHFFSPWH
jgi:hypothetical protein